MRLAAIFIFASPNTITGLLPPSSSVTGVKCSAAFFITIFPTSEFPVKNILSNFKSSSFSDTVLSPSTTAIYSSSKVSAVRLLTILEVDGAYSDSFNIAVFPPAIAPMSGIMDR